MTDTWPPTSERIERVATVAPVPHLELRQVGNRVEVVRSAPPPPEHETQGAYP